MRKLRKMMDCVKRNWKEANEMMHMRDRYISSAAS